MTFQPDQIEKLKGPLDSKNVVTREQGNQVLSYIQGWHAIDKANEIFGFDAWTRETLEMKEVRQTLGKDKWGNDQHRVGFIAKVRITAGGVFRDGTGYGSGIAKDLGDAYESAVKEAETDAMKRALMTFGNPFGLALYDKTQSNVVDVPEQQEPPTQSKAEKLIAQRPSGKRFDSKADSETVLQTHLTAIALAGTQAELKLFGVENKREIDFLFDEHWADLMITVKQLMSQLPEGHMENAA